MKINSDKSLLRNLLYSLILFGRIKTTKTRAKASSGIADKLVNKIKKGTTAGRRDVLKFITEKEAVEKLEKEIIPKLRKRKSGYTRIIKIGTRVGDRAAMVLMEWVFDEEPKEEVEKVEKVVKVKKGKG